MPLRTHSNLIEKMNTSIISDIKFVDLENFKKTNKCIINKTTSPYNRSLLWSFFLIF